MDRVVELALSRHPRVGQADADSGAAEARAGQARSARYPALSASGSYGRSRDWNGSSSTGLWSVSASLAQVIADFGRTEGAVARGDSLASSVRDSAAAVRLDVAFDARLAYLAALRAERILGVRQEATHQRAALLTQAKSYHEAGLRARIDVVRAEADLYQARAELNAAANDVALSRLVLLERIGEEGRPPFALAPAPAVEVWPGGAAEWKRQAEEGRPELAAARSRVAAAEAELRQARAGHAPVLSGNGAYGYAADEPPLRKDYSLALVLNVPIFSGGLTSAQVREKEEQLRAARGGYEVLLRQVRLQVEQAALALAEAWDRIEVRRKQEEAAKENLQLATGRYEAGAGDIIEMTDAQFQWELAETSFVGAVYDYNAAVATIRRAVGR
jgi:outer membrane protein TolC